MRGQASAVGNVVVLWVAVVVVGLPPAASDPAPPMFPASYSTVQVSQCLRESVFCPQGFVNLTIASQSYYDYANARAASIDANDINSPGAQAVGDQTFVAMAGGSLTTTLYFRAPGAATLGCFTTSIPAAAFPPPDMLRNASYLGVSQFAHQKVNGWQAPAAYGRQIYYTSVASGQFVGSATADGSQVATFLYFTPQPLTDRPFQRPAGVTCSPRQSVGGAAATHMPLPRLPPLMVDGLQPSRPSGVP